MNNKKPDTVGKLSLWENFDENKKHIMSGTMEINGEVYRVSIYPSKFSDKPNSPNFYGYVTTSGNKVQNQVVEEEPQPKQAKKPKVDKVVIEVPSSDEIDDLEF